LGEIWIPLENLAILVGLAESGEILGKRVEILWNTEKLGATVRQGQEELESDISAMVDACI
jgi:hypothetical protein